MGLAAAVNEIIDSLRSTPDSENEGRDIWERLVGIIANQDSLPHKELEVIEKAIEKAYRGWSDAQRNVGQSGTKQRAA